MRLLSILSLALVLLTSEVSARPGSKRNATLSAIIAKRQTNRNEISLRAHVKDVVKRVTKQNAVERAASTDSTHTEVTRTQPIARQEGQPSQGLRKRALPARERAATEATRVQHVARQEGQPSQGLRKRSLPAPEHATRVQHVARQEGQPSQGLRKRTLPGKKRSVDTPAAEERSEYPKCKKGASRTGYAHYPGWALAGDELSGALPVKSESACVQACNKYGGSCSGISFDSENERCFLKGTQPSAWDFTAGLVEDGVDLVGGCALWANIVPAEMDAVCCRD